MFKIRLYRKLGVDNKDKKLTFWIQTPNLLGTLYRADVAWNLDYTSLYSYCLWKCNLNLKIINMKLVDITKEYVRIFSLLFCCLFQKKCSSNSWDVQTFHVVVFQRLRTYQFNKFRMAL